MTFALLFVAMWLASSLLMCGWLTAELQEFWVDSPDKQKKRFPKHLGNSLLICLALGWLGPIGILIAYLITGFGSDGWQITPKTYK